MDFFGFSIVIANFNSGKMSRLDSHYNVDKVIGQTTCLSNQLGYVFHDENASFDYGKFLMID